MSYIFQKKKRIKNVIIFKNVLSKRKLNNQKLFSFKLTALLERQKTPLCKVSIKKKVGYTPNLFLLLFVVWYVETSTHCVRTNCGFDKLKIKLFGVNQQYPK